MASRVNGFQEMVARLNSYSTNVQQEVKELTEYYLGEIETEAIAAAPSGGDKIITEHGPINQNSISDKRRGSFVPINQAIGITLDRSGYKGSVYVEKSAGDVAAYVEFGTGQSAKTYLATVPQYWKSVAQLYYVNGNGSILAKPYLFPAFFKNRNLYKKELKGVFKQVRL